MKRYFKASDLIIYAFVILMIFGFLFFRLKNSSEENYLFIKTPENSFYYPLFEYQTYEIAGKVGTTTVEVSANGVKVLSSPCKEALCQKGNFLHKSGDFRACLPNGVLVSIVTKQKNVKRELDEVAY